MFAAFREGMKNNSHFARPSIWMAALLIVGCSDTKTETVEVPVPGATVTTTVVETVTVEEPHPWILARRQWLEACSSR